MAGLSLNAKVDVWCGSGRRIYRAHREEALRLLEASQAIPHPDMPARVIILQSHPDQLGLCRTRTGRRYTRVERIAEGAHIHQHKKIYPEDRHLFQATVLQSQPHTAPFARA